MFKQEKAKIVKSLKIAPRFTQITFHAPYISKHSTPGQFANIRICDGPKPLLRKPLSIHNVNPNEETFEVLFEIVGEGTQRLSEAGVGQRLDVLGPLGNGFSIPENLTQAVLIGGGVGVAPLLYLAKTLKNKTDKISVLLGSRNQEALLCENDFKNLNLEVIISTDDGSAGTKGLVSDLFRNQLTAYNLQLTTIYACGPRLMLKKVSELALQHNLDCQVSLEEYMACGIGACMGCVTKTKNGYKTVCKDGPVFEAKELVWE